jgi:hypothetical protein
MKKIVCIVMMAAGLAALSYAQFDVSLSRDLLRTATAWVFENLNPTIKRQVNGITVDGCTLSPDGASVGGRYINWRAACDQHDLDYANPSMTKEEADLKFYYAMLDKGAPEAIARLYYQYVRERGMPYWTAAQRSSLPGRR